MKGRGRELGQQGELPSEDRDESGSNRPKVQLHGTAIRSNYNLKNYYKGRFDSEMQNYGSHIHTVDFQEIPFHQLRDVQLLNELQK